jgi:hypothetical protein
LILLHSLYTIFHIPPAVLALAFASSYASLSILRVLPYLIREILFSCGQAGLDIGIIFEDQWHASSGSSCSKVELDATQRIEMVLMHDTLDMLGRLRANPPERRSCSPA